MPNYKLNSDRCKVIVVGNLKAGKTALMRSLVAGTFYWKAFNHDYKPTMGADLFCLQKESMQFQIWDLSGDKHANMYNNLLIIVYVLDSTKEIEENKRIFQKFSKEASSWVSMPGRLQMIVFTKSDDENSKLSQDYLNEFDAFNILTIVSSAKTYKGVDEIRDKWFSYFSGVVSIKELVFEIESYSRKLSKKHSQIARNKATALEAIAKVCLDGGMSRHRLHDRSLTREQIAKIKEIITEKKETISQHRHWSVFNWFFELFDPSFLERRVTSNKLVNKLEAYLKRSIDNLESLRPANH